MEDGGLKILIDLYLDGYETDDDHREACLVFVEEQLDMTASSIEILWKEGDGKYDLG